MFTLVGETLEIEADAVHSSGRDWISMALQLSRDSLDGTLTPLIEKGTAFAFAVGFMSLHVRLTIFQSFLVQRNLRDE